MAGVKGRSGGHNRLSAEEHRRRENSRIDRHADETLEAPNPSNNSAQRFDTNGDPIDERLTVSEARRRETLAGLPPAARRIAENALDTFWDWPAEALAMLRSYALCCHRIALLESAEPVDRAAVRTETLTAQRLRLALKLT